MSDLHMLMKLKAEMARNGLAPMHVYPWWSPDTESMVNPLDDPEAQAAIRALVHRLWRGEFHGEGS